MSPESIDYRSAGVDNVGEIGALQALGDRVRRTFNFAGAPGQPGAVQLDLGYFANVIDIGGGMGMAISTDGVGTKLLVAEMMEKYDTVGIDCIAMNVNDVLCVGARPITLVDYIAVERVDAAIMAAVADGLLKGAELAGVSIPGGEFAQVREMVRGIRPGSGFDIVGTAVGLVPLDRVIVGDAIADGDIVIGLASAGIHSNGLTLARKALFDAAGHVPDTYVDELGRSVGEELLDRVIVGDAIADGDIVIGLASAGIHSNGLTLARKALFDAAGHVPDTYIDELGRSVGEELLEPTRIYVRQVLPLLENGTDVKALAHITGNGLLNLLRVKSDIGFEITDMPEPQPIFRLIQNAAKVDDAEMYRVFNMGIGFCVVVPEAQVDVALQTLQDSGDAPAQVIGHARADRPGAILLAGRGLVGTEDGGFVAAS